MTAADPCGNKPIPYQVHKGSSVGADHGGVLSTEPFVRNEEYYERWEDSAPTPVDTGGVVARRTGKTWNEEMDGDPTIDAALQKQIEELYRDFGNPDAAKDAAKAVSATNISEVVKVKNTINPFAKPKKTAEQEAIEAFLGPAKLIMKPEQAKPTVDSKLDSDKPKIAKSINPFATGKR